LFIDENKRRRLEEDRKKIDRLKNYTTALSIQQKKWEIKEKKTFLIVNGRME